MHGAVDRPDSAEPKKRAGLGRWTESIDGSSGRRNAPDGPLIL